MTVDLSLTIIASELMIPWLPIPLSLKPWKGKWSGPLEGAAFTCTVPVSIASLMRMAVLMLLVNKHPCSQQCCQHSRSMEHREHNCMKLHLSELVSNHLNARATLAGGQRGGGGGAKGTLRAPNMPESSERQACRTSLQILAATVLWRLRLAAQSASKHTVTKTATNLLQCPMLGSVQWFAVIPMQTMLHQHCSDLQLRCCSVTMQP